MADIGRRAWLTDAVLLSARRFHKETGYEAYYCVDHKAHCSFGSTPAHGQGLREMKRIGLALTFAWCVIIIELVALVNAYVVNLKGATIDAERFIDSAVIWTKFGHLEFVTNSEFYIQFLGLIFMITGPSEFIATQFGILAMIAGGIFFIKLSEELRIDIPNWALLAFFLWPTAITRITTTLREPYLILFTVMICYYVVAYKNRQNISDIVKLFGVCGVAFLFHKAFAVFFIFGLGYIIFYILKPEGSWFKSRVVLMRVSLIGFTAAILAYIMLFQSNVSGLKPLIAVLTGDTDYIGQVIDYKSSREFRTTYDAAIDVSSPLAFLISAPKAFIYYMFSPFPWQISSPIDLLASLEGLLRLGALYLFVKYCLVKKTFTAALAPMMMLVLVLCFIWAAGTSNYGTASRHHLTTNWAFLMIYLVWFSHTARSLSGAGQHRSADVYRTS